MDTLLKILIKDVKELLKCCELNLDDMEFETRKCIQNVELDIEYMEE